MKPNLRTGAFSALVVLLLIGCDPAKPASAPARAVAPLAVDPAVDLLPSAGLNWLVQVRPRDLLADPEILSASSLIITSAQWTAFAERNGLDPRQLSEVVFANYGASSLLVGRGYIDSGRVEAMFTRRAAIEARAIDSVRADNGLQTAPIVRLWGDVRAHREQLAIFDRSLVALEVGRFGILRAVEAFAQGKLKRARPALQTSPLDRAVAVVGDAPVRIFVPGPFENDPNGLGGLLRACTGIGVAVRPIAAPPEARSRARIEVVAAFLGSWKRTDAQGGDPGARLDAAFNLLAQDGLGKLCGLDRPLEGPKTEVREDALIFRVSLDALALARGIAAATNANIADVMAY